MDSSELSPHSFFSNISHINRQIESSKLCNEILWQYGEELEKSGYIWDDTNNISYKSSKNINQMSKQMSLLLAFLIATTLVICDFIGYDADIVSNTSCTTDCCKTLHTRSPMTYYFYQNTGRFRGGSGEWAVNTMTYSGQGKGYLNPDYQCVVNTGPLPATTYKLATCVNIMHETTQRPCSFYLEPQKPSEMCGRSAFFIHGCQCCTPQDDPQPPAAGCSAGCIVMNYANRLKLRIGDTLIVQHYEPKGEEQMIEQHGAVQYEGEIKQDVFASKLQKAMELLGKILGKGIIEQ